MKIKVKLFTLNNLPLLEENINDWLEEESINVWKICQSQQGGYLGEYMISVWYIEKGEKNDSNMD